MARTRNEHPQLKLRNDVWYVFWYDAERKHERKESLGTKDHAQAAIKFAEFLVKGPADAAARAGLPGLKATVEQVLDWYDNGHLGTVAAPERQRYAFIPLKAFFKNKAIGSVNVEACRAYKVARTLQPRGLFKAKVSDSTVRREMAVLSAAAHHAVKFERMGIDQLPKIEFPAEPDEKAPWLTKASLRILFDRADGPLRDFCLLAYYWGSRKSAVGHLTKSQVDLQHGRVDLHTPGAKRTKKRKPIVPIYPEIRPIVERLMMADGDYLFGGPRDFYESFKKLCSDHNIRAVDAPDDIPWPHLLRHSRATHMLMDGEDPYKVAKLLGDTLATVERVYGHHSTEYLATNSTVEEVA